MTIPTYPLHNQGLRVHDLKAYLRRAGQAAQRSHRHDFWQIIAFKGNGSHHVDLQSHQYKTGTLLILASGAVHRFCGPNTQGLMLHFPAAFFSRGAGDVSRLLRLRAIALETPIVTPAPSDRTRLRALLQEFRDEANRAPEDKQMQQNMLHTLALLLLRSSPKPAKTTCDFWSASKISIRSARQLLSWHTHYESPPNGFSP